MKIIYTLILIFALGLCFSGCKSHEESFPERHSLEARVMRAVNHDDFVGFSKCFASIDEIKAYEKTLSTPDKPVKIADDSDLSGRHANISETWTRLHKLADEQKIHLRYLHPARTEMKGVADDLHRIDELTIIMSDNEGREVALRFFPVIKCNGRWLAVDIVPPGMKEESK